jgi:pimeloyl-ACP methyl ester carboxylesterase
MVRLPPAIFIAVAVFAAAGNTPTIAQTGQNQSRTVRPVVAGHTMRAKAAGLAGRTPGQPVVILEGGLLQALETWDIVFNRIAAFAPVVSYDRRGIGESEFDGEPQTLSHVAGSLHALLAELKVSPPYVIVGHSYGGILIRAFAREYPMGVAGMVYVDAPDTDLTLADLDRITFGARGSLPNELDQLPQDLPVGMKAEIDNMRRLVGGDLTELNAVRPPAGIATAVLVAAGKLDDGNDPTPRSIREARLRLAMNHELDWALSAPDGLFLVTRRGGHNMHVDNPDLTVQAIQYIVTVAGARPVTK